MSWPSPQQEKFLSAFAFAYAKTKPYSSQRNRFLKKLGCIWSTLWPLKPRREQTRVRLVEPRSNYSDNVVRIRCSMPSSASSIRERSKALVDQDFDHAHTVAHAAGMLIQFPDCRFPPSSDCAAETMDDAARFMSEEVTDAGVRLRQPQ